jgi:quinol monooxygenase YgiN
MSIVILLTIKAKPETYENLKAGIAKILKDTKTFKGCLGVYAGGNPADHSILLYERWESPEAHRAYAAWRAENGGLKEIAHGFSEPPHSITIEDVFA